MAIRPTSQTVGRLHLITCESSLKAEQDESGAASIASVAAGLKLTAGRARSAGATGKVGPKILFWLEVEIELSTRDGRHLGQQWIIKEAEDNESNIARGIDFGRSHGIGPAHLRLARVWSFEAITTSHNNNMNLLSQP